jgi:tetratricopeptide (TPR) repeat protein
MLFENANSSIKAILYGVAFIFLISKFYRFKKLKFNKAAIILGLIVLLYLIIISNSRIVWFGILVIMYLLFIVKSYKLKNIYKIAFTAIGLLIGLCFFFYKLNSSLGRLLIYKINFQIIKDHWLYGTNKPYNILFNHYQADYFSKNINATITEKLLASNGFFVFNEWLNIFLHFGLLGFVISIFLSIFLIINALRKIQIGKQVTAASIILFLLIVATVSYPFNFCIFQLIFIICTIQLMHKVIFKIKWKFVFFLTYFFLIIFFAKKEYELYKFNNIYNKIFTLFQTGYFNKSLEIYHQHNENSSFDGPINFQIAKVHYQKNNIDSSLIYLSKAHEHYCTDDLHIFWGDCLLQQKRLHEALLHFQTAANIVPSKFGSKIKVLNVHLFLKDTANAIDVAKDIINFPEKIPSAKSKFYKLQAAIFLKKVD